MARRRRRNKPAFRVDIVGDDVQHLKAQNEHFQKHYNRVILDVALQPAADQVEQIAKSLSPVLSGFMQQTIEQKQRMSKNKATISVRPDYRLYDDYFYAPVQEFGSPDRNIPAVRYMRRAAQAVKPILQRLLEMATNRAIQTYRPLPTEDGVTQ